MRIKQLMISMIMFVLAGQTQAQGFAPIGAQWHYTEYFSFSIQVSFLSISVTGDTLINDQLCRKLTYKDQLWCTFHSEAVYEEDSAVYYYMPQLDTFQLLFDMKAMAGDGWTSIFLTDISSPGQYDTVRVIVDSTSQIVINGHPLKRMFVSYHNVNPDYQTLTYSSIIDGKLGDISYLFNLYSLSGTICDANYSGGLRCYQDPEFGFYETGIADSCEYTTAIHEIQGINNMRVFPNPAFKLVNIVLNTPEQAEVKLIDQQGRVLICQRFESPTSLDVSNIDTGIYVVVLSPSSGKCQYTKLIIYE
ncbi:MAG: T9SS type A sorting domain-containing protein [Bacteroidales bacterium]|nr:T9SS type A sorting domain-containing protein [Bacteroidales bacterium]